MKRLFTKAGYSKAISKDNFYIIRSVRVIESVLSSRELFQCPDDFRIVQQQISVSTEGHLLVQDGHTTQVFKVGIFPKVLKPGCTVCDTMTHYLQSTRRQ